MEDIAKLQPAPANPQPADNSGRSWVDRELWQRLAASVDANTFYNAWLDLQCHQIDGVTAGIVLAETESEKTFAPAASWPSEGAPQQVLISLARSALEDEEALVVNLQEEYGREIAPSANATGLAFPLRIHGYIVCVAAISIDADPERDLESEMRRLQWGVSWLEAFYLRFQSASDEATIDRLVTALFLTATASSKSSLGESVTAFVTELATRLDCERVSCGFLRRRHVRVESVSHTGHFGRQMNLVNAIGKAMDEAVDQKSMINYPESSESGHITLHHDSLSRQQNGGAILTVPMTADGKVTGAICIERSVGESFDQDTVQLCESIASVAGPIFLDKKLNDRWIVTKIRDSIATQIGRLIGPRYIGRKLFLLILIGLIAALYYARGEFRITADTVLEGAEQRALVSPYDGYVATSLKRVGDRVSTGDVIATLDDTDLRLDLVEISSGKAQALSQYDEAVAAYDRAKTKVFKAKLDQADARIALVNEKLKRTRLISPLDGMIVKGDLSQSLGAAIGRGEVLFEIATLYQYRVFLQVDERDISYIKPGQSVQLLLSALPDERYDVVVESIKPVTVAAEGRNFFRVEATLHDEQGLLRPGMEGIAKIDIEERRYIWIWTRELVNWLRLWFWRWSD